MSFSKWYQCIKAAPVTIGKLERDLKTAQDHIVDLSEENSALRAALLKLDNRVTLLEMVDESEVEVVEIKPKKRKK